MFNKSACLIENKNFSFTCVDSETPFFTVCSKVSISSFSCKPLADLDSNVISSAYIRQCTSFPLTFTGSDVFDK